MSAGTSRQPARGRPRRRSGDDGSSESGESDHDTSTYEGNQTQRNDTGEDIRPRRTRTLMTAQQLAILFDLLAQTRFPTSAQREEAGRQTGLPARKVQVWFQNQRQKQSDAAKRAATMYPGGPPEASTSNRPVYASTGASRIQEPRTNYPQHMATGSGLPGGGRPSVFETRGRESRAAQNRTMAWQQQQQRHGTAAYGERSVPQSGGPSSYGMAPVRLPATEGPTSAESYRLRSLRASPSPPRGEPPSYAYVIAEEELRLPPLRFDRGGQPGTPISPTSSTRSYASPISSSFPIPPPFTLEPQPLWDATRATGRTMRPSPNLPPPNRTPDRQRSGNSTYDQTRLPSPDVPPQSSQYSPHQYVRTVPRAPPMEMRPSPQPPSASSPRGSQMPPTASGSGSTAAGASASQSRRWGWGSRPQRPRS